MNQTKDEMVSDALECIDYYKDKAEGSETKCQFLLYLSAFLFIMWRCV